MDAKFGPLIAAVLAVEPLSAAWHRAIKDLVKKLMLSRPIARRRQGHPLEGIYLELHNELQDKLTTKIKQVAQADRINKHTSTDWFLAIQQETCQQLLTYERLTQLAVYAQQQPSQSAAREYALSELFAAVILSKQVRPPSWYGQLQPGEYDDIVSEVYEKAIRQLSKFDPERSHFIGWINNVLLEKRGIDVRKRQTDTLMRGHRNRVMPIKYALRATLRKVKREAIWTQLQFYLTSPVTASYVEAYLLLSMVLGVLKGLLQSDADTGNKLLYDMAEVAAGGALEVQRLDAPVTYEDGREQAQEVSGQMPQSPPLIDFLMECLQTCEGDACQNTLYRHVQGHPQATFQLIALRRLEGQTLKEIGDKFGLIPQTIRNFYERNRKHVENCLANCVDDRWELWKMQHPH